MTKTKGTNKPRAFVIDGDDEPVPQLGGASLNDVERYSMQPVDDAGLVLFGEPIVVIAVEAIDCSCGNAKCPRNGRPHERRYVTFTPDGARAVAERLVTIANGVEDAARKQQQQAHQQKH